MYHALTVCMSTVNGSAVVGVTTIYTCPFHTVRVRALSHACVRCHAHVQLGLAWPAAPCLHACVQCSADLSSLWVRGLSSGGGRQPMQATDRSTADDEEDAAAAASKFHFIWFLLVDQLN